MPKKWSEIITSEEFKALPRQEQEVVARQYVKLTNSSGMTHQKAEPLPESAKAVLQYNRDVVTGKKAREGASNIKRLLATPISEMTEQQKEEVLGVMPIGGAGWIGSAKSANTPAITERLKFALELKQKGADPKAIWEDTGIFDFGAGARYFDLSVIDEYVKNTGKLVSDKGFISLRGQVGDQYPSLVKHIPTEIQQKYLVIKDHNLKSAGLHDPNTQRIYYNPNKISADGVIPHELQHAIQQTQKLPSRGYNTKGAENILRNSPKLLTELDKRNKDSLKKYLSINDVSYDIYRHNIGEAEASISQVYHNFIRNEVLKGTPPEKIRAAVQKQNPYTLLEQRYTTKKLWKEGDVKVASSESSEKLMEELTKTIQKMKKEEPKLKVKLTKEDLKKTPKVLKEQGF